MSTPVFLLLIVTLMYNVDSAGPQRKWISLGSDKHSSSSSSHYSVPIVGEANREWWLEYQLKMSNQKLAALRPKYQNLQRQVLAMESIEMQFINSQEELKSLRLQTSQTLEALAIERKKSESIQEELNATKNEATFVEDQHRQEIEQLRSSLQQEERKALRQQQEKYDEQLMQKINETRVACQTELENAVAKVQQECAEQIRHAVATAERECADKIEEVEKRAAAAVENEKDRMRKLVKALEQRKEASVVNTLSIKTAASNSIKTGTSKTQTKSKRKKSEISNK